MDREIWDLYDKDENLRGKFVRGKGMIPDGLYHKTVEVIPTDMEGHLLITRRSLLKKRGGGQWEFPAGSVISGETEANAAYRELQEETGLKATKLYFIQKARSRGIIRYTFVAFIPDMTKKNVSYDPDEVMDHAFTTFDKWFDMLTSTEYSSFRTSVYTERLFDNVKKLVNKFAESATPSEPETEPGKQQEPLRKTNALATKKPRHLDERCYEKDPVLPPNADAWEPEFEQGDDGA